MIHFFETTEKRRIRLGGHAHGQALCSTGDGHQKTTTIKNQVTCPTCLKALKQFVSLNITTPPTYSGTLGSAWFEEARQGIDKKLIEEEAEKRRIYVEQIKNEKVNVIIKNKLKFVSIYHESYSIGLNFERETETKLFRYSFSIQEREIADLEKRINQKINIKD